MKKAGEKLKDDQKQSLVHLFQAWCGEEASHFIAIPGSGSNRAYYRVLGSHHTAIGVINADYRENRAFIHMTRFFRNERIAVPALLGEDLKRDVYLTEDLGDQTLFDLITQNPDVKDVETQTREMIREALRELARIQVVAGRKMDFSICYPYPRFNRSSIAFDLHYFRDQFLEQTGLNYDKQQIEKDFEHLASLILEADQEYFMYRDFQSRNIMVRQNQLYFIDYQGGRKGPLQYDLAAFLYQARARLPESFRDQMVEHYLKVARMLTPIDERAFRKYFYPIALLRVLQTLGAYGLRGLKEKKEHFIQSIPYALKNLNNLHPRIPELKDLPELQRIIHHMMYIKIPYNEANQ